MLDVVNGLITNAANPYRPKRGRRVAQAAPPTPLQAAESDLRDLVKRYKEAILPLKARLGRFCSYCEQPLPDAAPVEHVVPKAPFPAFVLCWDNFLLSCNQCNAVKGDKPPMGEVRGWNVLPPNPTVLDWYPAVRAHYVFPDNGPHTSTNVYSYRGLIPTLFYWDSGLQQWRQVDDAISVRNGLTLLDPGDDEHKYLQVRFALPQGPVDAYVRAQLVPTGAGAVQAGASIAQMDLANDGAGKNGDNRMWDRTARWVSAVRAFSALAANWDNGHYDTVCDNAAHGFLSTWIRVLQLRGAGAVAFPPDNTQNLLGAFLTRMTQQAANPRGAYPATDTTLIP
jgi:hypothetical protein